MRVFIALHEERYPLAVFSTREAAERWVTRREQGAYMFSIEEEVLDQPRA
jgi:hypothetical protein